MTDDEIDLAAEILDSSLAAVGSARMLDPTQLPDDLPVPEDDGATAHLKEQPLPPVALRGHRRHERAARRAARAQRRVRLSAHRAAGRGARRGGDAGWNAIPGARGCTPEACSFRDELARFREVGARVFGLSTQDTEYQREAVERLHLPYLLLSDERPASSPARWSCRPSRSRA